MNTFNIIVDFSEKGLAVLADKLEKVYNNEHFEYDKEWLLINDEAAVSYFNDFHSTFSEGNGLKIEIPAHETKAGCPEIIELDDDCFVWETVEVEEE